MGPMEHPYRHEFKYLCSSAELAVLRVRLFGLMRPDPHVGTDGMYRIRSLYFDDCQDTCLRENEAGTDPREKFRIRIYNGKEGADQPGAEAEGTGHDQEAVLPSDRGTVPHPDGRPDSGSDAGGPGAPAQTLSADAHEAYGAQSHCGVRQGSLCISSGKRADYHG